MRAFHLTSLLCVLASPAFGQDVSLQRCRAVVDPAARLACYDALADGPRPAAPVAAAAPVPAVRAAPAATSVAAVPPARTGEAGFGLPESRRPEAVESVQSAVGPRFDGWGPNSRIRLDNGQVWQVVDGSSTSLPERARKVTVKRGALGSFYLDIEGLNTSPRVRRVD